MARVEIPFERFQVAPVQAWEGDAFLLAAGDLGARDWNCMTVAWGSFGVMWGKPLAMIVVRPTRYTWHFTEKHPTFTLSAFPAEWSEALAYCGNHSGRDVDKMKETGLTPEPARAVAAPAFRQAELVVECRKIYGHDFDPRAFLEPWIAANYPSKDYHRMYFGEIVAITGTAAYIAKE